MSRIPPLRIWSVFQPEDVAMLRQAASPIDLQILAETSTQTLIDQMLTTMRRAEGIGLAAPQIGQSIRLAVIDRAVDPGLSNDVVLVNPTWTPLGTIQQTSEEGCLSIPKVFGEVDRHSRITVVAFDRQGQRFTLTAQDLLARVIQHEIDHLNGILFIDHATAITRGQELLP